MQQTPRLPVATATKNAFEVGERKTFSLVVKKECLGLREKQQSTLTQPDRWIQNGSSGLGSDARNCHNVSARQSNEYLGHVSTAGACWSESRMSEKHKNKDA